MPYAEIYALIGYLSGSVLYAEVFCRIFGRKNAIEQSRDANPGTANAFLYGGFWCGICTLIFDMAKGFVPVYAYVHMTQMNLAESNGLALVLAAPVAGHIFPVWRHFKGGKGIAVSFGSLLGLIPMWYPVLSLAGCFLFFSLVIQISPNFYRTVAVYIVNWLIIVFSETNLPKAVHIGVGLISLLILLKMHMSQEEREKMTFQLLWIKR